MICKDFIIPFAKQSGITSFSSMQQVKKALGTKKIGHTGTLDSFADGLLVLLSGNLTKLASVITADRKTYEVKAEFGEETDSLDPEGCVILEKPLPEYTALLKAIDQFKGKYLQVPPAYSAVRINGKRASDRVRSGEKVELKARPVEIYSIKGFSFLTESGLCAKDGCKVKSACFTVDCSKGTYIRSLVRDIAAAASSCAYVKALRRMAVGTFSLTEAAGSYLLPNFKDAEPKAFLSEKIIPIPNAEIERAAIPLTEDISRKCAVNILQLDEKYAKQFLSGQKIRPYWFFNNENKDPHEKTNAASIVFCRGRCYGIITEFCGYYKYSSVFGCPLEIE